MTLGSVTTVSLNHRSSRQRSAAMLGGSDTTPKTAATDSAASCACVSLIVSVLQPSW